MKILSVVGARPQFIKAAAFSRKLRQTTDWVEVIVHTGQHFDPNMSEVFFREMEIPNPDYNLQVHTLSHGAMTGRMLEKLEEVLLFQRPDLVLVYGDTNSTLAGALAAKKLHIPVAHVEAGLRSYDERMPEEVNRIITDRISDYLFAPSESAAEILKREGVPKDRIHVVGDIMFDALQFYSKRKNQDELPLSLPEQYVLLTLHRQENTDDPKKLRSITEAVNSISEKVQVVIPIHPRTRNKLSESEIELNAITIDPVGYLEMLRLISGAELVLTDSGGLQKEAFYLNKFCITLRENTEWTELVDLGVNKICGSEPQNILSAFTEFSTQNFPEHANPYGKAEAADKIIEVLRSFTLG